MTLRVTHTLTHTYILTDSHAHIQTVIGRLMVVERVSTTFRCVRCVCVCVCVCACVVSFSLSTCVAWIVQCWCWALQLFLVLVGQGHS